MRYISTRGDCPGARLRRRPARGPRRRRRPLSCRRVAALLADEMRGLRGLALCRARRPRHAAFLGGQIDDGGLPPHRARGLCRLRPPGGGAAEAARRPRLAAGAVPRPDARLQGHGAAAARPPVRPCAGASAASASPSSAPPPATPARPPSRPAATAQPSTSSSCIRDGRVSEVQRRQMTTVLAPNVHNIAVEGTFDDCQDLVKAMFTDPRFRDELQLCRRSTRSTGRGSWPRSSITSPPRWRSARPSGAVAFAVPTGNFGNVYAGYAARAHGAADRAADRRRPTATTSWRASSPRAT